MSTTDSRTHSGCWTCRARRKKCDEGGQPCLTCISLQLPCHGYGPRPYWMDWGLKEKAQLEKFKAIVKRSTKLKRRSIALSKRERVDRFSILYQSNTSIKPHGTVSDSLADVPPINGLLSPSLAPATMPSYQPQLSPYLSSNTTSTPEKGLYNEILLSEVPANLTGIAPFSNLSSFPHSDLEAFFNLPEPCIPADSSALGLSGFNDSSDSHELYLTRAPSFLPNISSFTRVSEQLNELAPHELTAILYYFETILPLEFPFLDPYTIQVVCNELLILARSSKSCISSILSQGIFGQQSERSKLGLCLEEDFTELAMSYERISIERLHESVQFLGVTAEEDGETYKDVRQVEVQVSAAQIMLSKMLRRDSTWPHFQNIIASLNPIDFTQFGDGNQTAIRLFQNTLICLDILSCVSTGMEPEFALKFRDKFRAGQNTLRLDEITGCENSVMECIMNIAVLRHWKEKETTNGSMSLIELAKRALPVDRDLQEIRGKNLYRIKNHSILTSSMKNIWILTNVFACAASIYLHVTVSGPRPEIPEIKIGVADTIDAIKLLPNGGLLNRLMWPVCVAACLAEADHRSFFEQLERGIVEQFGSRQNILRALSVAKECWKLRRCSTLSRMDSDWTDAMASIGDIVLLLF